LDDSDLIKPQMTFNGINMFKRENFLKRTLRVCTYINYKMKNFKRSLPWYQQRLVDSNETVLSPLKKEAVYLGVHVDV
jgi:hypothetical protein